MLNGKHYDALSGKLIRESSSTPSQATHKETRKQTAGSIDGVVDTSHTDKRSRAVHKTARAVQHSKTLMRSVVKKPHKPAKTAETKATPTPIKKRVEHLSAQTNPIREHRAKQVSKSSLISKFGITTGPKTKLSPIPVKPEPKPQQNSPQKPLQHRTTDLETNGNTTSTPRFQGAIDNATSHTQQKPKRLNRRTRVAHKLRVSPTLLNVSLVALTFVILGGYFAYNNVPNLAMRVASTRSGINGSLPEYQPAGFAMKGAIQYQPGQLTIGFKSNSDERNYTVSERTSEWDSETLLENHVAVNKRAYQTFQDQGKTIYIYDGDSASWVDNGIWYEIDGNSSLDTDQVLRIANSL